MFQFAIPDITISAVLPVILVAVTGLVALIVEMLAPKRDNSLLMLVSIAGLVVTGVVLFMQLGDMAFTMLPGSIEHDTLGTILQLILVGCTGITVLFSDRYLRQKRVPFGEFYPLVLWSATGAMLMTITTNLMIIFIGLEILSIALYVMAGMSREERKSEESAMKYFLLGAFASGFLLYGIAFFYGATGTLDLSSAAIAWSHNVGESRLLMAFGVGLILIGLGFKAGFVPFHQWTPDVYQGAPTNVTAFMATAVKIGAFGALFRLLGDTGVLSYVWAPALSVVAILTMLLGNILALAQTDVKRVLAYSSISHAGYILVDLIARGSAAPQVSYATLCYYLMSYAFMTLGSFVIISMFAKNGEEGTNYEDLKGLWQRSPLAATLLVIFMLSLIGIPPMAGFFGKAFIFSDALQAHLTLLPIVLAISSTISVAYYLRIALVAVSLEDANRRIDLRTAPFGGTLAGAAIICAIGVIGSAVFYAPLMDALKLSTPPLRQAQVGQSLPKLASLAQKRI